jgi:hypothetical protein
VRARWGSEVALAHGELVDATRFELLALQIARTNTLVLDAGQAIALRADVARNHRAK